MNSLNQGYKNSKSDLHTLRCFRLNTIKVVFEQKRQKYIVKNDDFQIIIIWNLIICLKTDWTQFGATFKNRDVCC